MAHFCIRISPGDMARNQLHYVDSSMCTHVATHNDNQTSVGSLCLGSERSKLGTMLADLYANMVYLVLSLILL